METRLLKKYVSLVLAVMFVLSLATVTPALSADKVNINTDGKEKLVSLTGIGEEKAEKIIEYRKEHKFETKKDILEVNGIGEATFAKIKDDIVVE